MNRLGHAKFIHFLMFVASVLAVSTLAACGGNNNEQRNSDSSVTADLAEISDIGWESCMITPKPACDGDIAAIGKTQDTADEIANNDDLSPEDKEHLLNKMIDYSEKFCQACIPIIERRKGDL